MVTILSLLRQAFAAGEAPDQRDFSSLIDLADKARSLSGTAPGGPPLGNGLSLGEDGRLRVREEILDNVLSDGLIANLGQMPVARLAGIWSALYKKASSRGRNPLAPDTSGSNAAASAPAIRAAAISAAELKRVFANGRLPESSAYLALVDAAAQGAKAVGRLAPTGAGHGLEYEPGGKLAVAQEVRSRTFTNANLMAMPVSDRAWIYENLLRSQRV